MPKSLQFTRQGTGVGLLVLGLTLMALWPLRNLHFDGELAALLSIDDPVRVQFQLASAEAGEQDILFVACPAELPGDLVMKLQEQPGIARLFPSFGGAEQGLSALPLRLSATENDLAQITPLVTEIEALLAEIAPECGLTGSAAYLVQSRAQQETDLNQAGVIAGLAALLLFVGLLRAGLLALLALLPVGIGILWGLALFALWQPTLTLLAATVPTLIFGIGLDHVIHQLQASRHGLRSGLDKSEAIRLASRQLRRPIVISSLTTAGVFASLGSAELKGLADFGLAGAAVSLGVSASCLLLVPLLLRLCPKRLLCREARSELWLAPLASWLTGRPKGLLAMIMGLTLLTLFAARELEMLGDNRQLESPTISSRVWQQRLSDTLKLNTAPLLLSFEDAGLARRALLADGLPEVVSRLQPDPQAAKLLLVHSHLDLYDADSYRQLTSAMKNWLTSIGIDNVVLSGAPALNDRISFLLATDAEQVLLLAGAMLVGCLLLLNRGRRDTLAMLMPLLLGLCWTVAWMALTGRPLSVVSAAIAPLVLGMGIDDGVHMSCAWRRHRGNLLDVYRETGTALVMTTLTTVAAFAAFMTTDSPALVMLGEQASIALLGCLLATLLVLPLLLNQRKNHD